jgi:hypothetical protein
MTRARRQRTRTESDVIVALSTTGAQVSYSLENWHKLVAAKFFDEPRALTPAELARCIELLEDWREQRAADERARRFPNG